MEWKESFLWNKTCKVSGKIWGTNFMVFRKKNVKSHRLLSCTTMLNLWNIYLHKIFVSPLLRVCIDGMNLPNILARQVSSVSLVSGCHHFVGRSRNWKKIPFSREQKWRRERTWWSLFFDKSWKSFGALWLKCRNRTRPLSKLHGTLRKYELWSNRSAKI